MRLRSFFMTGDNIPSKYNFSWYLRHCWRKFMHARAALKRRQPTLTLSREQDYLALSRKKKTARKKCRRHSPPPCMSEHINRLCRMKEQPPDYSWLQTTRNISPPAEKFRQRFSGDETSSTKKVPPCCKQENAAVVAYVYQREVWAVPISVLSPSSAISQKVGRKQHRGGGRGKNAFAVEIRVDAFSSLHFTSSLLPLLARIRSFLSPEKKSNSPISLTNHELFFSPFSSYAIFATEMRSHMWKGGRNIKVVRSKTHPGKTGPDTLTCGKGGGGAKKACQRLFPPERNLMNAACVAAAMMCLREEIQRNTELSQRVPPCTLTVMFAQPRPLPLFLPVVCHPIFEDQWT